MVDSHFMNDLGLDSLDQVEVIMAMEDEFGELTECLSVLRYACTLIGNKVQCNLTMELLLK